MAEDIRLLLQAKDIVFVFGNYGNERYRMFKPYANGHEFFNGGVSDGRYVIFYSGEGTEAPDNGAVFIPLRGLNYLKNFVFVLPPVISAEGAEDVSALNEIFLFDEGRWAKNIYACLLIEEFPYGKMAEIEFLKALKKTKTAEDKNIDIHICFLHTGRQFGYTDITNEDEAFQQAKNDYMKNGCACFFHKIYADLLTLCLKDALFLQKPYHERVKEVFVRELQNKYNYFKRWYEDDYRDEVCGSISIQEELKNICSYEKWAAHMGMGLYDCWLAGLEAELKPKWVKVLEAFILGMCAEKLYLGNPQAEMEGFFNMQWDYFLKSARLKFINAAATPAFKDKYSYVAGTKDAVVLFMICVNDFFNNYLKEKTEGFIESKYALWSVRKDT